MSDSTSVHILVVDDDPRIRKVLRRCFEGEGYGVSEADNADEARRKIAEANIDLVTLDLTLPGQDGLSLARELRSSSNIPIIMVTGKGDMIDRVVGLEIGADDYISKPFHQREVLARVRSVLRRTEARTGQSKTAGPSEPTNGKYRFENWVLDPGMRELRYEDGSLQNLTTAEYSLLEILVSHPRKVLSRDAIMDLLKGRDWTPLDRAIDTQIARLRKKIETAPEEPRIIKTIRGVGYMFTAEVEQS